MATARSRRRPAGDDESDLGLPPLAHANGTESLDGSILPPGRRDGAGFWYPSRYRSPLELFTPYQRSLQEKQRRVQRRRRVTMAEARLDTAVPLPSPVSEVVERRPPAGPPATARAAARVDSPARSE